MSESPVAVRPRWLTRAVVCAVACTALVALLVYANALHNDFAFDDVFIVQRNRLVHDLHNLADVPLSRYWPNTANAHALYRPTTMVTYLIDWVLWHGGAAGFHGTNVVLHALVAALLVLLLARLGATPLLAGTAGVLFAVHPVHVEAVANIVGRAEELVALCVLAACLLHLASRVPRPVRMLGIAALYLVALGAKESGVALPAALILVDALRPERDRPLWRAVWNDLPLYLLLGAVLGLYLAIRYAVLGVFSGTTLAPGLEGLATSSRIATAVRVWPDYLRLLVFPRVLIADYAPHIIDPVTWASPRVWLGLVVGGAAIGVAVWAGRRSTWAPVALGWFVATVFVVSNLVIPVGIWLAERNFYLPSVAIAFAWVAGWRLVPSRVARTTPVLAVTAVLALAGAWRTWTRTPVWRTTETLIANLAAEHPESYRAEVYQANRLLDEDQPAAALAHYRAARTVLAHDVTINAGYAEALRRTGALEEAAEVGRASCTPTTLRACYTALDALMERGALREATTYLDSLQRHAPPTVELLERRVRMDSLLVDTAGLRQSRRQLAALRAMRAAADSTGPMS